MTCIVCARRAQVWIAGRSARQRKGKEKEEVDSIRQAWPSRWFRCQALATDGISTSRCVQEWQGQVRTRVTSAAPQPVISDQMREIGAEMTACPEKEWKVSDNQIWSCSKCHTIRVPLIIALIYSSVHWKEEHYRKREREERVSLRVRSEEKRKRKNIIQGTGLSCQFFLHWSNSIANCLCF